MAKAGRSAETAERDETPSREGIAPRKVVGSFGRGVFFAGTFILKDVDGTLRCFRPNGFGRELSDLFPNHFAFGGRDKVGAAQNNGVRALYSRERFAQKTGGNDTSSAERIERVKEKDI